MTTYHFNCPQTGQRWQRVHVSKAKKMFCKGIELRGIPNKMALFGAWANGGFSIFYNKEDNMHTLERQFEIRENGIAVFNCCSQLGYTVAWYAREKDVLEHRFKRPKLDK